MPRLAGAGEPQGKVNPSRVPSQGPHPTSIPKYGVQDVNPTDLTGAINSVERNGIHLLPARQVLDLANLGHDQRDIAIAARMIARQYDLQPQVIFGNHDPRKVLSRVTGQPVSMREARRFTASFSPVAVASMLAHVIPNETYVRGHKVQTASPERVAKLANIISDHFDVPLTTGVGLAYKIAQDGVVSPNRFAQNLGWVVRWWGATSNQPMDAQRVLGIAIGLSEHSTKTFRSIADVQDAYAPGARQAQQSLGPEPSAVGTGQLGDINGISAEYIKYKAIQQAEQRAAVANGQAVPAEVGPDYWKQVQGIADQVKLDANAMQHSWLGVVLNKVGEWGGHYWNGVEKGLGDLGLGIVAPVAFGLAAGKGLVTGSGVAAEERNVYRNIVQTHQHLYALINSGENAGNIVADGWGAKLGVHAPDWVGNAIDFGIGWVADPLVVGGKFLGAARDARVMESLDHSSMLKDALEKVPGISKAIASRNETIAAMRRDKLLGYVTDALPSSYRSRRLFNAIGDETKFNREFDSWASMGTRSSTTLDPQYMKLLHDRILELYGPDAAKSAEAWQAWQDGMRAHFIGWGPEGSAAEWAVNSRLDRARSATQDLASSLDPNAVPPDFAQAAMTYFPDRADMWHAPFSVEAPTGSRASLFGPRTLARRAITSQRFSETGFGKAVMALPSINPGRQMPLFGDGAADYVKMHATRWNAVSGSSLKTVFDTRQIEAFRSEAMHILNSGGAVETRLNQLVNDINAQAFDQLTKGLNYTPEALGELQQLAFGHSFATGTPNVFGVIEEPTLEAGFREVNTPLLESQLQNFAYVVDPVQVRALLNKYTGLFRRIKEYNQKALGLEQTAITSLNDSAYHRIALDILGWGSAAENGLRKLWKAGVVARPGYVPRVVLGDENARFLSVTQSALERVMSQRMMAKALDRGDIGLFTKEFAIGDAKVALKSPGWYDNNPLAVNDMRNTELLDEILRNANNFDAAAKATGIRWDVLDATRNPTDHMVGWNWGLTKQLPNSTVGTIAMKSIADGEDLATTQQRLLDWAAADHYVTLRSRMGVSAAETQDWANNLAQVVHQYTMDNPKIAQAALFGDAKDLRQILESIPLDKRPLIHGPTADSLTKGLQGNYGLGRALDKLYKTFVTYPENNWNRQPFYRAMQRRAEYGMYSQLEAAAKADPALADAVTVDRAAIAPDVFQVPPRSGSVLPDQNIDLTGMAPRPAVGDASGYVYHLSPNENLASIADTGLLPKQSFYGIPADQIPPEMRGGRLFFADSIDRAKELAHNGTGEQVAFRVKAADVGPVLPEKSFSGSMFSRDAVSPGKIEVLGKDGEWRPVTSLSPTQFGSSTTRVVKPEIAAQIKEGATNFALDQVGRVMFDFTKQSRFTELLQFAFPFPQPFFEGFQAWAHLIRRNPETVGRALTMYRAAKNNGWIYQDPISGQEVVSLAPITKAAYALGPVLGLSKQEMDSFGLSFSAPLTSFNLLASTTLRIPAGGVLGKVAGGVPVPMPGLAPEFSALMQKAFANSTNEAAVSYLFQFGPSTQFLPRFAQVAMRTFAPQLFEDNYQKSLATTLLSAYQANHVMFTDPKTGQKYGFDENGNPVNEKLLLAHASDTAQHLATLRSWMSLFSPAAPSLGTDAKQWEALWTQYQQDNPDYQTALDKWTKDHPDKWLIPIGKTFATANITDPVSGKEFFAPRLPASKVVLEMLNSPGVGPIMQSDKAWAGLFLIGLDPTVVNQQDWPTFSRMLADGTFRYKTPEQFLAQGENNKVWGKIDEFYTKTWTPGMQNIDAHNLSTQDLAYTQLVKARTDFFNALYQQYPTWVQTHLSPITDAHGETVGWNWPQDSPQVPVELTLAHARQIVATPGLENFPGVVALKSFLNLQDKVGTELKNKGFSDIFQQSAQDAGITNQFANGVQKLIKQTPGIEPYLRAMFGIQIQDGQLTGSDVLRNFVTAKNAQFASLPDTLAQRAVNYDTKLNVMQNAAYKEFLLPYQRSQNYVAIQRFQDHTWQDNPKVLNAWWKAQGPQGQAAYRETLALRTPAFYTAWDWHVMGHDLSPKAIGYWERVAQDQANIQERDQNSAAFGTGAAYDALNKWVHDRIDPKSKDYDKTFAASVQTANDWTFPFRASHLADQPGKLGKAWTGLIEGIGTLQKQVEGAGLGGKSSFSDTQAQQQWYRDQQKAVASYVEWYKQHSSAFASQWDDLNGKVGGIIGNLILPDSYYGPLGAVNYGG